jgi:predicted nucleotidyltransferase
MDKKTALKIARNYVTFIASHGYYKVRGAFLFGSYTKNHFTDESDIDIALVLEGYKDTVKELSKLMQLRRNFDLRIEPHPITKKDFKDDYPLNKEIKKSLRIL